MRRTVTEATPGTGIVTSLRLLGKVCLLYCIQTLKNPIILDQIPKDKGEEKIGLHGLYWTGESYYDGVMETIQIPPEAQAAKEFVTQKPQLTDMFSMGEKYARGFMSEMNGGLAEDLDGAKNPLDRELEKEGVNLENLKEDEALWMIQTSFESIIGKEIPFGTQTDEKVLLDTYYALGKIYGAVSELDRSGKTLVVGLERDEETLNSTFSFRTVEKALIEKVQLKGEEAIVTAEKAQALADMLSLNQDYLAVDLFEWFSIGTVAWNGEVLMNERQNRSIVTAEADEHNRLTRFETELVPIDRFARVFREVRDESTSELEEILGRVHYDTKRARQIFDQLISDLLQRRGRESQSGTIITDLLGEGTIDEKEFWVKTGKDLKKNIKLSQIPKLARGEIATLLQQRLDSVRYSDTDPIAAPLRKWIIVKLAESIGLAQAKEVSTGKEIFVAEDDPRLGQKDERSRKTLVTGTCDMELQGLTKTHRRHEKEDSFDMDKILDTAREVQKLLGLPNRHRGLADSLPVTNVIGKEAHTLGIGNLDLELEMFLDDVVKTAPDISQYSQAAILSAFALRVQALATLRAAEKPPNGNSRGKGELRGKNYWNGVKQGFVMVAQELGYNESVFTNPFKITYTQTEDGIPHSFQFNRKGKEMGASIFPGDQPEDEIIRQAQEILENCYERNGVITKKERVTS